MNSDTIVGKTCPYCQTPIKPNAAAVVCSACEMPHHAECWQENGRCTTYGCNGSPLGAEGAPLRPLGIMPPAPALPGHLPPAPPAEGRPHWAISPEPERVTLEPQGQPAGLRRWNWGAFVLAPFWALGMRLWGWCVLCLVPYLGFFIAIYLGARGNELAWKSRRWRGIEEFDLVQEAWAQFGLMIMLAAMVAGLLMLGSRM
ncbi:MAG: RING finger protein [Armatimonadota bacterium]